MEILQNIWMGLCSDNEMLIGIINFPLSIIEIYLSVLLFLSIFNIDSNKKQKTLYVLTFSIFATFSRYIIPDPYGTFINLIICPILVFFIFKTTLFKSILAEFIPSLLFLIVDSILLKIFMIFFYINSEQRLLIPIYRIIFSMIEYTFLFLIYLVIKKIKVNIPLLDNFTKKEKLILINNFIFGMLAIITQTYVITFYINLLPILLVLLSVSSLIIYFVISFYSLFSTSKLNLAKQNLEETRLMNKTLTELNDKIRAFRHDFNNIIQALGGYIGVKDYEGLEKYYNQLLKDCQDVNNLTALNTESINNPAIYSLIASKYYLATEQNIEFNLDIFMDLNSINMKIYEFCRILGILLDNAIQATQECAEKKVTITIRADSKNNRQLLIIENTYKDKEIDTEKIYEKGYSTKEGNTGLGLWEVRQILKKNTNLNLFTSKDDTLFKQQLEIYNS